jgi:Base plate wedge protein 53
MPYFSNMPVFDYPLVVNGKTKYINARNIMVRAKFLDYIKDTQAAYLNYTIRDGERPETLAYRIYGDATLHWVVLLFNEILDPLFEWPLSSYDLESSVNAKYQGKALFVDLRSVQYKKNGRMDIAKEELWYEVGSKITQVDSTGKVISSGTILSWDPDLYKIVVQQDETPIAGFGVTTGMGNDTNPYLDYVHTRSDGISLYARIGKVVQINREAVHHFIDQTLGGIADHHAKIMNNDGSVLDSCIIERYAKYGQERILLSNRTIFSVSNYQHEIEQNEKKRIIKVMRPELIDVVVKDMRKVFGG